MPNTCNSDYCSFLNYVYTPDKSAPYGGLSLFYISGIATSPKPLANGFDPEAIRDELEDLGDRMNCEITIEDIEDDDDDDE